MLKEGGHLPGKNPEMSERQKLTITHHEDKEAIYPFLRIESPQEVRQVPVYSVREPFHYSAIAKAIASGAVIAFEVGVMGIMIAVEDPRTGKDNWKKFWEVKRGRASQDKVPMMMLPKDQYKVVDFNKLHKDFQYLRDPQKRHEFFGSLPFHTILPFKESVRHINRDAFVTTSEDSKKKPADQYVPSSTICIYFQGGDKVWVNIAERVKHYNPYVQLGISSLNDHGEQSPYTFEELVGYVNKKQRIDFDYVVRDPIAARAQIKSSHTQIRLPLEGEPAEILVVRKGPVSAETISKHTGHPVRVLASAKFASRGYPENVSLDGRVLEYLKEANLHHMQIAKQRRGFAFPSFHRISS